MKSNLGRASEYEVFMWIENNIELTPYQKSKFDAEVVRLSPFYFYKVRQKETVSPLWRLTLLIYPIYLLFAYLYLPIKFLITGKWGYGRNFIDKFHLPWAKKLGFKL
jgi:hypothetical protein